jgi:multidrug efflux pump
MSVGTLLTIFVVPTVYTWFARRAVPGAIETPENQEPAPAVPQAAGVGRLAGQGGAD